MKNSLALNGLLVSLLAFSGCYDPERPPANGCIKISLEKAWSEKKDPETGTRAPFVNGNLHVQTCNGLGIPNLSRENFVITEENGTFSKSEGAALVVGTRRDIDMRTLVLLDLSGSVITEKGALANIQKATQTLVSRVLSNTSSKHKMNVATFDGRDGIKKLWAFTPSAERLNKAVSKISQNCPGELCADSSTNLWGAIYYAREEVRFTLNEEALNENGEWDSLHPNERGKEASTHSLVIFTDGTDQAGRYKEDWVMDRVNEFKKDGNTIYTVAVGSELSNETLAKLSSYPEARTRVGSIGQVASMFEKVGRQISANSRAHYQFKYCTPRRADDQKIKIKVKYDGVESNTLTIGYDASSFSGICPAEGRKGS